MNPSEAGPNRVKRSGNLVLALACGYVVWFCCYFYSRTLYNSAPRVEDRATRLDVLERTYGPSEPGNPNLLVRMARQLAEPANLVDRASAFVAAFAMLAACWGFGSAGLRIFLVRSGGNLVSLPWIDEIVISFGLGVTSVGLLTQWLGLAGVLNQPSAWIVITAGMLSGGWPVWRGGLRWKDSSSFALGWWLLAAAPFVVTMVLGAALPTTDYDALAYHLLGPKEWFLGGRIEFLSHNVYTNFPFLTEMFPLLGMMLCDDWASGAIAGQVFLSFMGPTTALACAMWGGRLFGQPAGTMAAIVYVTAPWVYRLSTIPYVEGTMLLFLVLAVDAASRPMLLVHRFWPVLAGIFAGAAFGCKYPAIVMVGAPVGIVLLFRGIFGREQSRDLEATDDWDHPPGAELTRRTTTTSLWTMVGPAAVFLVAFAATLGTWLLRNWWWTGNPVFPLLYQWFGGRDWSAELADRFARAHSPASYSLSSFWIAAKEVVAESDWQSGLVFAFAPLALLHREWRRSAWCWAYVAYLFFSFWLWTHRLDRFWLPVEPVVAVLAGAGMSWIARPAWRWLVAAVVLVSLPYNLAYEASGLCGLANYTAPLELQRRENIPRVSPSVALANFDPPPFPRDRAVLFVGCAGVFEAKPRARYSTVFNRNIFEDLCRLPGTDDQKSGAEIRRAFAEAGIGAIIVDWEWIGRYRSPGNYGYSSFVQPARFDRLVSEGVLEVVWPKGKANASLVLYRVIP